jgi:hypothetical protein
MQIVFVTFAAMLWQPKEKALPIAEEPSVAVNAS